MNTATVQASCFAKSYSDSRKLAEAVIATLLPEASVDAGYLAPALVLRLRGSAEVTALAGDRIFWTAAPQTAGYPRVVLNVVGGDRAEHLDSGPVPIGTKILFWAASATEPRDLGDQSESEGFIFHAAPDLTVRWANGI